jgi:hypothetical protein
MTDPSDTLTTAVAAWITATTTRLNPERAELMRACVASADTDLRVIVTLKEGTIVFEGTNAGAGKSVELYREEVEPMRAVEVVH